jgi:cell division protein FtsB
MKLVNLVILVLFSLVATSGNDELNRLIEKRQQQEAKYKSISDSAIVNRWVKQSLLFNQLQVIKALDDSIIDQSALLVTSGAAMHDSLESTNDKLLQVSLDAERATAKAVNDMKMLLILKIAVAVLLLIVLALVYVLYRQRPGNDKKIDMLEKKNKELEVEREHLKNEVVRLKARENQVKEELERGIHQQKEKFDLLSSKNSQLEADIASLKKSMDQRETEYNVKVNDSIKQLTDERDQLNAQVAALNNQLGDSKSKHEAMLRKINKLISDLSGVND